MAGHQQTDQMAASLASQGLQEDAVPFNSTPLHQNVPQRGTGIDLQQTRSSLSSTPSFAVPPQMRTSRTAISSSLPSQNMLTQESRSISPVNPNSGSDALSLQQDLLKQVDPKAVKAVTGIIPSSGSSISPSMSSSLTDLPSLKKTPSLKVDDISDEDIENYKKQFPKDIRSDIYDAMIIHQDEDVQEVLQFLSRVNSDVQLSQGEKAKVVLYTDVRPDIGTPIGQLDESLSLCTYVFLYVTKKFCSDGWTEFSSQTCLMDAIYNSEKKWSVVPIFTEPRRQATYKIPASIRSLKGIQYWSEDKFYADSLRKLLDDKLYVRKSKEVELKHKRKMWILKKKAEEIREQDRREQETRHAAEEEMLTQSMYEKAKEKKEFQHVKRIQLLDQSQMEQLCQEYSRHTYETGYLQYLSKCFTAPANLDSYMGADVPPVFHSSLSMPHKSAVQTPSGTYLPREMTQSLEGTSSYIPHFTVSNLSSDSELSKSMDDSNTFPSLTAPQAQISKSSGTELCPLSVSSDHSSPLSSGSGSMSRIYSQTHYNNPKVTTLGTGSESVLRGNEMDKHYKYFDLPATDHNKTMASPGSMAVSQRRGGNSQESILHLTEDTSAQQQRGLLLPAGSERLSASPDIEEDIPPASRVSTGNLGEVQMLQQVSGTQINSANTASVLPRQSHLPSQAPGNIMAGPTNPFTEHQHGPHVGSHHSPLMAASQYVSGLQYIPPERFPTSASVPGHYNPYLHLGQQVKEIHHHHYVNPYVPPTINIKKVENVMVGETVQITQKDNRRGRHKADYQSPVRDREDGFQDTTPGEFDPEELVSRGPDSLSLPSNVPISGLTGHVTADRIQSQPVSSMTSPELQGEGSRKNLQYGLADLPRAHSSVGNGSIRYPPPSPHEGIPAMAVKPVAVTKPFNSSVEKSQWRREYDAQHETEVKRPGESRTESRELVDSNNSETEEETTLKSKRT
ncbi:uncharacterized protein LOC112554205 [Pomacea canaliculata]|uniref:uncharacterized protein LOC112554205 n=1 Tax=Pomacea canaliculata TaxID=400727 RepID=UPI000D73DB4B|nr:uncharacterized protein LOC112554205 [Pomacea canaliculata]XP_025077642.1 uncharacterized protein LOC112554205 [Pomacea canaliculata]